MGTQIPAYDQRRNHIIKLLLVPAILQFDLWALRFSVSSLHPAFGQFHHGGKRKFKVIPHDWQRGKGGVKQKVQLENQAK